MRRPFRSLVVLTVLSPALVVAPAVLSDVSPDPRPVAPEVQEIVLPDADSTLTKQAQRGEAQPTVETGELDTSDFSVVGVTWAPTGGTADVVVELKTRTDGEWTDWSQLNPDEAQTDAAAPDAAARGGTEPVWAGDADGVQVRLTVLSGAPPQDVTVSLVDPGESPADASVASTPPSSAAAASPRPQIHSRGDWGADERLRRGGASYSSTVRAITLHHTASGNNYEQGDVPALIRGFYAYHTRSRGWSDIGYNVLVDKYGGIWEGRHGGVERPVLGAHAGGFNTDTAGVSMIGNYESTEPPTAMLDSVAQVMAWKLSLHGRDPHGSVTLTSRGSTRYRAGTPVRLPVIFGHNQVSSTACPGARAIGHMPALRDRVAGYMQGAAPAPAESPPIGVLDSAEETFQGEDASDVGVRGWALDRNTDAPVRVRVSLDGRPRTEVLADASRPDIDAAYGQGDAHGFVTTLTGVRPGRHEVCVDAIDPATGEVVRLGCATLSTGPPLPPVVGGLDGVAVTPTGIRQQGYAYDPQDTASPTTVDVLVDGKLATTATTGERRADISLADANAPETTGWSAEVAAEPGVHTVCAVAHRVGRTDAGSPVGCQDVWVLAGVAPLGHLDVIQPVPGEGVRVQGWALDARTSESTFVQVLVDGEQVAEVEAGMARPDVGRVYPGYGPFHGYSTVVPIDLGVHEVCVQAVDRATRSQVRPLGCADRFVSGNPQGGIDLLERTGDGLRVVGWAIDADVDGPSPVRIRVGDENHGILAGVERPDLLDFGHGAEHGFDETFPVGPERTTVCIWGLNNGPGDSHRILGCGTR